MDRESGTTLCVASTGGHLDELSRIIRAVTPATPDVEWVTFDDPQIASSLRGEVVHFLPYIPPRGYKEIMRAVPLVSALLRSGRYSRIISTGSAIAIPFMALARRYRIPCHYVESAARSQGPSATGKVVSAFPWVTSYTQYSGWTSGKWHNRGSLFDRYEAVERPAAPEQAHRVVVTLGTMRKYGFRSAVESLALVLPEVLAPGAEVLWQVGVTDTTDLPIAAVDRIPAQELSAAVQAADLVISHAGVGSALTALDAGIGPVLLPRRHFRDEHVDDHQQLIAEELMGRGLAVSRAPAELSAENLRESMRIEVVTNESAFHFPLA
ncbi:MAG: glycosyl transferase family 28 [Actinomycetota bacterium]|nr:glycosyl transferase family 28 [Actinomycetota bacterium]